MSSEQLKLAVVASAFSADPRVGPALARKAGFGGLQFDARSAALDIAELSSTGKREFRHLLGAQGVQLVGLRCDLGSKGFALGADVDRELSRLHRVMEAATELNAPLVCIDLGPLPSPAETDPAKPKITPDMAGRILLPTAGDVGKAPPAVPSRPASPPDPATVSQIDAALVELGRLADRTSTILALRGDLSSFAALERALRAAGCPWFGVDLDPAAVLSDAWNLDEIFSRLGPLIRHVRARDAIGGADRRTRPAPVGRGDTDWLALLANLHDADYTGWITIDPTELPDRPAAAGFALKHLRSLA